MLRHSSITLVAALAACATAPDVEAVRHRQLIADGAMDLIHGGGQIHDVLFLPVAGVRVQVVWRRRDFALDLEDRPIMYAWFGPPDENPREPVTIRLPADLARQIVRLAQQRQECDELGARLGRMAVDAGAVGGRDSVKSRDDEPWPLR